MKKKIPSLSSKIKTPPNRINPNTPHPTARALPFIGELSGPLNIPMFSPLGLILRPHVFREKGIRHQGLTFGLLFHDVIALDCDLIDGIWLMQVWPEFTEQPNQAKN